MIKVLSCHRSAATVCTVSSTDGAVDLALAELAIAVGVYRGQETCVVRAKLASERLAKLLAVEHACRAVGSHRGQAGLLTGDRCGCEGVRV